MIQVTHTPYTVKCTVCGKFEVYETLNHNQMKGIKSRFSKAHEKCAEKLKQKP